jgi:uncharacterized membrane protein
MSSFFAFDQDPIWNVLIRFLVSLLVQFIVIRLIYFRYTKNKGSVFSFFQMGIMIFLVCILLKTVEVQLGIALGLFAIFAIMRFRSQNLPLRQMTYFFTVIGISVINAMANFYQPVRGTIVINAIIILSVFLLEKFFNRTASEKSKKKSKKKMQKKAYKKTILLYNRLELLDPGNESDLLSDISSRTHMKIEKAEIRKIDLVKGTAELEISYKDKESGEK